MSEEEIIDFLEKEIVNNDIVFRQWFEDMEYDEEEKIRTSIKNLIRRNQELEEKCKEFEEERKQFYDGEIYTVNQLKNIEKTTHKYWIHKSKIKEIIYPTPTNPISHEIQTSDMYRKILQLLEEK